MVISPERIRSLKLYSAIAMLMFIIGAIGLPARGAVFGQTYVRLDRLKAATASSGMICAQPATIDTEGKIAITFPTGFTVNTTAANWTTTTTNIPAGATAWPGIGTASTVAGQVVTFPSGDLTVGTLYCFNFAGTNTLTNGGVGNSQKGFVTSLTAADVTIDQTKYAVSIISDDQITVTATVPPIFVFTLASNADTFPGDLDPSVINSTSGVLVTITTNAKGGWIAWAKDSQQGLYSASVNYKINTLGTVDGAPTTLVAGTEAYQLDVNATLDAAGGCTLNSAAEYNGAAANQGGTFTSPFTPIASCTGASPATANGDQITLIERAAISGSTPAGTDYSDIITVVAAGNF